MHAWSAARENAVSRQSRVRSDDSAAAARSSIAKNPARGMRPGPPAAPAADVAPVETSTRTVPLPDAECSLPGCPSFASELIIRTGRQFAVVDPYRAALHPYTDRTDDHAPDETDEHQVPEHLEHH